MLKAKVEEMKDKVIMVVMRRDFPLMEWSRTQGQGGRDEG